jgi:class 3 adenylate cyclase/tetratricopeptide (TPR) repeat protein
VPGNKNSGALDCYVPRVVLRRLATACDDRVQTLDGTVVFVDVSGFTKLSERLARIGKEGAEQLVGVINSCFSELLADAYEYGGSLLKFGGDALLLWFEGEGHPARGCACAVAMRSTLRRVGRIEAGARKIVLRMSVGVHSGRYQMFLVGESHREFLIAGPSATTVVAMEATASAGQILISPDTAALLPRTCLGATLGAGILLARAPSKLAPVPFDAPPHPSDDSIAVCLSTVLRAHILAAGTDVPEHRTATPAFLEFGQLDRLIADRGPQNAGDALHELVCTVQEASDRYQVCFLGSDISAGGGKLLFCGGAPLAFGDDEERLLLALRQVIDAEPSLPVRIGVNRGQVFCGEVGPPYRRTYVAMGDTTNLAARLMAKAPWGSIYATRGVIDRSRTPFATTDVPPFMVKGKSRPIEAWELGQPQRAALHGPDSRRLPLIGRERELAALRASIAQACEGVGSMVEIVGETGSGKSRLLAEARDLASEMRFVHTTCEAYTRSVPYAGWQDPLRQLLGLSWDDTAKVVVKRLRAELEANQPDLLPWLPLVAIVLDVPVPSTPEVDELAPDYRVAKLHEVVIAFLREAMAVPTLVQIEHGHLMDDASADLLHALATVLGSSSWTVIVTRRDVEDGFVATEEDAVRLELAPMSRAEAIALAESTPESHSIPPHLLERAVDRCGGSPEFLLDLLAAAAGGSKTLPDSIEGAAAARIDALDPDDRVLVRRASVLGLFFHPERLRDVLGSDVPIPDEGTWERLASVFVRDPDGHTRFKRPALQEVAYGSLPFELRRELHAAVAHSLERDVGEDVDADPAVLSLHYIIARNYERAWISAVTGAERAVKRLAHADAARLYRRAIEAGTISNVPVKELAGVWESLGAALRNAGELTAAAEAIKAARRLTADDPLAQGRLFYRHTIIAEQAARLPTAVRWASRGLRALDGLGNREATVWRARILARLAFYRIRQGRLAEAERLCRQAIAEAKPVKELEAEAFAYYMLDWALFNAGRFDEVVHSERALGLYHRLGDLEQEGGVLNNLAMFASIQGRWDEALELWRRAVDCGERAGIYGGVAVREVNIGELMSNRGLYDEASIHLERARRLFNSVGHRVGIAYAAALLGQLAVRAGSHSDGLDRLRGAIEELTRLGETGYAVFAEELLAEAEALGGDPERALDIAEKLIPAASRTLPLLHRARAIALAVLGRDEASDALAVSLDLARDRSALYDIAAGLDLALLLYGPDPERLSERDAILVQLGIERLPRPTRAVSEAAQPVAVLAG